MDSAGLYQPFAEEDKIEKEIPMISITSNDISRQGIITKEYQKRSKKSVSAKVVAILAVVSLIKDCYKMQKSHSKQNIFSHFMGPTGLLNTKVL